jgi:hypothetical protein
LTFAYENLNDICYTKNDINKLHAYYIIGLCHKNKKESDEMLSNYEMVINLYNDIEDKDDVELMPVIDECLTELIKYYAANDKVKLGSYFETMKEIYEYAYFNYVDVHESESSYINMLNNKYSNLYEYARYILQHQRAEATDILTNIIEEIISLKLRDERFDDIMAKCYFTLVELSNNIEYKIKCDEIFSKIFKTNQKNVNDYIENYYQNCFALAEGYTKEKQEVKKEYFINKTIELLLNKQIDEHRMDSYIHDLEKLVDFLAENKDYEKVADLLYNIFNNMITAKVHLKLSNEPISFIRDKLRYFTLKLLYNNKKVTKILNFQKLLILYNGIYPRGKVEPKPFNLEAQLIIYEEFQISYKFDTQRIKKTLLKSNFRQNNFFHTTMLFKLNTQISLRNFYSKAEKIYKIIFEPQPDSNRHAIAKPDVLGNIENYFLPLYIFGSTLVEVAEVRYNTIQKFNRYGILKHIMQSKRYKNKGNKYINLPTNLINVNQEIVVLLSQNIEHGKINLDDKFQKLIADSNVLLANHNNLMRSLGKYQPVTQLKEALELSKQYYIELDLPDKAKECEKLILQINNIV